MTNGTPEPSDAACGQRHGAKLRTCKPIHVWRQHLRHQIGGDTPPTSRGASQKIFIEVVIAGLSRPQDEMSTEITGLHKVSSERIAVGCSHGLVPSKLTRIRVRRVYPAYP